MGFSVSASTAIIFAGLFLAVGTLYPAVSNAHERVTDAEIERTDARLDMRNTEINIVAVGPDGNLSVRNEGATALDVDEIDVVVDGEYQPRSTYSRPPSELWVPGESISLTSFTESPDNRIKVVTEYGISDLEVV